MPGDCFILPLTRPIGPAIFLDRVKVEYLDIAVLLPEFKIEGSPDQSFPFIPGGQLHRPSSLVRDLALVCDQYGGSIGMTTRLSRNYRLSMPKLGGVYSAPVILPNFGPKFRLQPRLISTLPRV